MKLLTQKVAILIFIGLLLAGPVFAAQPAPSNDLVNILPKLPGADPSTIDSLGGLIVYLFNLGIWIVGIAIFVQFLRAGIEGFFSGPNLTKVQSAKEKMSNALLGFILLMAAWLILYVINPDLVGQTTVLPSVAPPVITDVP